VLNIKSHIFVNSTVGKGTTLFCLLTKTITIQAGEFISPAFFLNAEE